MPLFHKDAWGLPSLKIGKIEGLKFSAHALHRAEFKQIEISGMDLTTFNPPDWEIFELEVINGIPVKLAARRKFNNEFDLVIVILRKEKLIKTVWLNSIDDKHSTLDKSVYSRP